MQHYQNSELLSDSFSFGSDSDRGAEDAAVALLIDPVVWSKVPDPEVLKMIRWFLPHFHSALSQRSKEIPAIESSWDLSLQLPLSMGLGLCR